MHVHLWAVAYLGTVAFCSAQHNLEDSLKDVSALFPSQPGFDNATRAFNTRFHPIPAGITYPASVEEVSEIVKVGAAFNLAVVARSGGHNYVANGLGGDTSGSLVVDLSNLTTLSFASSNNAIIGAGSRLGTIAPFLNSHGRGIPHGSCAYVGIGGHAAFGGFGFASRMWGLNLDAVVGAQVVLANGTVAYASTTSHPDLFWAIRGSASSFGIITSLTFKTFTVPENGWIFNYDWTLNTTAAATQLATFQTRFATLHYPRTLSFEIVLTPAQVKGQVNVNLVGAWYGPKEQLEDVVAPFISGLTTPKNHGIGGGNWLDSVVNLAGGSLDVSQPDGRDNFYAKSLVTKRGHPVSEKAFRAFTEYLGNQGVGSQGWFLQMELWAGSNSSISAVPADATAFGQRDAFFSIQLYSSAPSLDVPYPQSGFDLVDGMVNSIVDTMGEGWPHGSYVNYIDDRLQDWQKAYYGTHYKRLQVLKKKYDPKNVFRFPTSIELP